MPLSFFEANVYSYPPLPSCATAQEMLQRYLGATRLASQFRVFEAATPVVCHPPFPPLLVTERAGSIVGLHDTPETAECLRSLQTAFEAVRCVVGASHVLSVI